MNIEKKLFEIQKQGAAVKKDGKNPFTKSNYITLDNIIETLSPIRDSQGILVYHYTEDGCVTTVAKDIEDGSQVISKFKLIESNDPQKLGSCITYAKRYNLGQIFNIVTDKDDDGNAAASVTQIK